MRPLRARQQLGKYKVERRLASGGFADVYRATDTVEGLPVALKVPRIETLGRDGLDGFQKEVRLTVRLDHPNILPIKNADFIDGYFVIAYPLGDRNLADRLRSRVAVRTALDYAEQILEAVAYAHEHRVIHCDVKPENFVLFDDDRVVKLGDFGIARFGFRTLAGSGSGTVGYLAPEQALGKLSSRSDVFSTGLVLYRMFSGRLPEWPFSWPGPGHEVLRRKFHRDLLAMLRRSLEVDARRRYRHAGEMLDAFVRVKRRALAHDTRRKNRKTGTRPGIDWRALRWKSFKKEHGAELETRHACRACGGPVSEIMQGCPWCGADRKSHDGDTRFPAVCPRCSRGVKLDWKFCAWCYGPAIGPISDREYPDRRYDGRCANAGCTRKVLMPFMRYCPWCRRKPTKRWRLPGSNQRCSKCGQGVSREYWEHCPWCRASL